MTQRTIQEYEQYWKNELLSTGAWHPDTETLHSDSFEYAHEVVVAIEPNLEEQKVEVTFYSEETDEHTGEYLGTAMSFGLEDVEEFVEKLRKVAAVLETSFKGANQSD